MTGIQDGDDALRAVGSGDVPGTGVPGGPGGEDLGVGVHPIEAESYRRLAARVDLSGFGPLGRAVVARIIHATADLDYAATMVAREADVRAGVAALAAGAPIVTDVEMVRSGLTAWLRQRAECFLGQASEAGGGPTPAESPTPAGTLPAVESPPGVGSPAPVGTPPADRAAAATTRSALGIRLAAARHPSGAILVVGCAPTALRAVLDLARAGRFQPALVVGLPVGFVDAADAKAALRASGLPAISNVGDKGGSGAAAAALNALARLAATWTPQSGDRR